METKKMTQAAVLCAGFVVTSIIAIGIGLGSLGYIDFIVPVFLGIIYLKCGLRYSILSSITSLLLIIFALGNIPAAIMMVQSMILGIIISILIQKNESIFDDLFYSCVFGCILMILMDINFSNLTGYSLLKECEGYLEHIPSNIEAYKDVIFYMSIATLPLGTGIICYVLTLLFADRLKILNNTSMKKVYLIKKYRTYSPLVSCSRKTIILSIIYIIGFRSISLSNILSKFTYTRIVLNSIEYVVLFFTLQDSFVMVNRAVYSLTKSRKKLMLCQLLIFFMLLQCFIPTCIFLITSNMILDRKFDIKAKNEQIINKIIV